MRVLRPCFAPLLAAALLLLPFILGCAPKHAGLPVLDSPEAAWQAFRRNYCAPRQAPGLKAKASLNYTRERPDKRSDRTRVTIWGDFDGAVRLDVSATLGKIVAMLREDRDGLLVFYPTEDKAYGHINPVLGATSLGMPFPFSLGDLARVVMGDFSGLSSERYVHVEPIGDNYRFSLRDAPAVAITLDRSGRPIIIEGLTATAYDSSRLWRLSMEKFGKETTPLPAKLTLTMNNGEKGVLRIKSRELRMSRWPAKSTELILPADTQLRWLDGRDTPTK